MKKGGIITDFVAEDGMEWKAWDYGAPLFDHFFIIGPKNFHDDIEPRCLYEFPQDGAGEEFGLERFLFLDGIQFKNIPAQTKRDCSELFCCMPSDLNEFIFIQNEAGSPVFEYCIRFRANPFSRPALPDDGEYMDDIRFYRTVGSVPSCLYAFCFVSSHPFHDVLFAILRILLMCEMKVRISSKNLHQLSNLEHVEHGDRDVWPFNAFNLRESVLRVFYEAELPSFQQTMVIALRGDETFTWRMPPLQDVPIQISQWGYHSLLDWISLDEFIDVLNALILETPIVVVGWNVSEVCRTVTFLPQLIAPFAWMFPIITLLPRSLTGMLHAPMSMLIGLYSRYRNEIPEDRFVIDLDTKRVVCNDELRSLMMPKRKNLEEVLHPIWSTREGEMHNSAVPNIMRIISEHLFNSLASNIVNSAMTKIDAVEEGTAFSVSVFKMRFGPADQAFLKRFMDTQLFQAYKEQVCRKKTEMRSCSTNAHFERDSSTEDFMTLGRYSMDPNRRGLIGMQPD